MKKELRIQVRTIDKRMQEILDFIDGNKIELSIPEDIYVPRGLNQKSERALILLQYGFSNLKEKCSIDKPIKTTKVSKESAVEERDWSGI